MDCRALPRLAFGLLDKDCLEDDMKTANVVGAAISSDPLRSVTLAEREPAQHPKTQISLAYSMPQSDQILPMNWRRLGVLRRVCD